MFHNKNPTYRSCQPVWKAVNRKFSHFYPGVIVELGRLVWNVLSIVNYYVINGSVVYRHVGEKAA